MTALIVNAPGEVGTGRAQGQANTNDMNCRGGAGDKQPDDAKAKATLAAQLALRGFVMKELADGSFMVSRWNMACELPDLAAVGAFALLVGVAP